MPEIHNILRIELQKAGFSDSDADFIIEKARSGVYKNTAENRKLGRQGKHYGESKDDDTADDYKIRTVNEVVAEKYSSILRNIIKELGGADYTKSPSVSVTSHGVSIYIQNQGYGKIRFSDHSVSNYDRIMNEEHYNLKSLDDYGDEIKTTIEQVLFPERFKRIELIGLDGSKIKTPKVRISETDNNTFSLKYEEVKEVNPNNIEVSSDELKKDDEIIRERLSKKGNKLFTVKRTYNKVYKKIINNKTGKSVEKIESTPEEYNLFYKQKIQKSFEDLFEKARSGKYKNTAENRQKKRVGQSYGVGSVKNVEDVIDGLISSVNKIEKLLKFAINKKPITDRISEHNSYIRAIRNDFDKPNKKEFIKDQFGLKSQEDLNKFIGDGEVVAVVNPLKSEPNCFAILTEDAMFFRTFDLESKTVYMNEFLLSPNLKKNSGIGTKTFHNQINSFKEQGFETVETYACRDENMNGYYTWARLGYKMVSENDKEQFKQKISESTDERIKSCEDVSELLSFEAGREYWKKEGVGFSFSGAFDLRDGSESLEILKKYINEPKQRAIKNQIQRQGRIAD